MSKVFTAFLDHAEGLIECMASTEAPDLPRADIAAVLLDEFERLFGNLPQHVTENEAAKASRLAERARQVRDMRATVRSH